MTFLIDLLGGSQYDFTICANKILNNAMASHLSDKLLYRGTLYR